MQITEFLERHLDEATDLFLKVYRQERRHCRTLPSMPFGDETRLWEGIAALAETGGVAAFEDGTLIGYLFHGYQFTFKGQTTVMVPEIGHAAALNASTAIYPKMLAHVGNFWSEQRASLHILGYLAHDADLETLLYRFGYGQILTERLRDLSAVGSGPEIDVEEGDDLDALAALDAEHRRYYAGSPIFVNKPAGDRETIIRDLDEERERGSVFFVHSRDGHPVGYFVVGPSAPDGEGLLLRATNSAQIRGAYVQPAYRSQGIGRALLDTCLRWADAQGFDRLLVEHESANLPGRAFWGRYFTPFVRYTMRYVELPEETTTTSH
jgi:GNAT superfamily N-acetyltransferase